MIQQIIKNARTLMGETQSQFGKRFGVNASAVSLWESGDREASYKVIEFCISKQWEVVQRITWALNSSPIAEGNERQG